MPHLSVAHISSDSVERKRERVSLAFARWLIILVECWVKCEHVVRDCWTLWDRETVSVGTPRDLIAYTNKLSLDDLVNHLPDWP